jgi:hypothetical protein
MTHRVRLNRMIGIHAASVKVQVLGVSDVLGWASSPEPAKPGLFKPGLSPALMWA